MTQSWFGMVSGRVRDRGSDVEGTEEEQKTERREGSYESCSMQKMRAVMGDSGRIICLPKRRVQLPYRI